MRIVNLSSGSEGNCTFIETDKTKLLLDDGINATQTLEKLKALAIDPSRLTAIVVSHEHSDHVKGIDVPLTKYLTEVRGQREGLKAKKQASLPPKCEQRSSFITPDIPDDEL